MAKCAIAHCTSQSVGKSKYCAPDRDEARARWVEMISAKEGNKAASKLAHRALFDKAHQAGMSAGNAAVPTPMVVERRANPFDDNSPVVQRWEPIMDGVCGFAWINIKPGNSSFALWLKGEGLGRPDSYRGGLSVRVGEFGQSYERKVAYASAFAGVLSKAGIRAYVESRLD